jgi:hypothetical protein
MRRAGLDGMLAAPMAGRQVPGRLAAVRVPGRLAAVRVPGPAGIRRAAGIMPGGNACGEPVPDVSGTAEIRSGSRPEPPAENKIIINRLVLVCVCSFRSLRPGILRLRPFVP